MGRVKWRGFLGERGYNDLDLLSPLAEDTMAVIIAFTFTVVSVYKG